jgi:pyridoxal phosphate enzyme (YggS family)
VNGGRQASQVAENLIAVRERIARAALRAGRDSRSVKLVAVSKVQPLDALRAALAAGQRALGENYAQELRDKAEALSAHDPPPEWHFLGALQTNKVKYVVGRAHLVHTCDRPSLAQELSKRAVAQGIVQRVLVEVNVGREAQKAGALPEAAGPFVRALAQLPGLSCRGGPASPLPRPPCAARPPAPRGAPPRAPRGAVDGHERRLRGGGRGGRHPGAGGDGDLRGAPGPSGTSGPLTCN